MAAPARPRRRKLLFAAIACGLFVVAVEGLAFVGWWVRTGAPFGYTDAHDRRARVAAGSRAATTNDAANAAAMSGRIVHPYLGYVYDPGRDDPLRVARARLPITPWGFVDDDEPIHRRAPDELIVALLGGSMAGMFAADGSDALAAALRADPRFAERRIRFVRLALGGFKQPQQLLALTWLLAEGAEFDIVVNLDGFNELTLPLIANVPHGVTPTFPYEWQTLAAASPTPTYLRAVGAVESLGATRSELARWFDASLLRGSVTANLVWLVTDDVLAGRVRDAEAAVLALPDAADSFATRGPAPRRADDPGLRTALVAHWQRASRQLHALCVANGARYVHVLQPNQYDDGSKPLSADERANAWLDDSPYRAPVRAGYPALRAAGAELAADGVRFLDLSGLFRDHAETLYVDTCCHVSPAGSALLAQAIAGFVLADPELGPPPPPLAPVVALSLAPARITLTAPWQTASLRAVGRTIAEASRDVTYAGVTFTSDAPDVATVDAFGTVRARGVGTATIRATQGTFDAIATVDVAFAPVLDLGGAAAARRGEQPTLRATLDGDDAVLEVHGLVGARDGVLGLAFAADPAPLCGGRSWVGVGGAMTLPLAVRDGRATVRVPLAGLAAGKTAYVQALFPEPAPACAFTLSNALALTRG